MGPARFHCATLLSVYWLRKKVSLPIVRSVLSRKNICQKWDSNPRPQKWTATWTQRLRPLGHPDLTNSCFIIKTQGNFSRLWDNFRWIPLRQRVKYLMVKLILIKLISHEGRTLKKLGGTGKGGCLMTWGVFYFDTLTLGRQLHIVLLHFLKIVWFNYPAP